MKIYSCTLNMRCVPNGYTILRSFNDPHGFKVSHTWIGHDFAQLSEAIEAFTHKHNIGASMFAPGPVYDDEGRIIGEVSYNCKVWPPHNPWASETPVPLYDPYADRTGA